MSELPKGWAQAELAEIALIEMGQSPDSRSYNTEGKGLPFFQGKAEFRSVFPEIKKWCSEPTKAVERGDILLSIRAPVGPTNIAPEKCCIGRGLAGLRAETGINQSYLFYYLRNIESWLSKQGTGSTFAAISGQFVRNIEIPIAPCREQTRIVAKLEELLSDLDAGVAELKAAQKKLKQYRQSLLKAAVEGTLTAEWREAQRKRHSTPLSPRGRGVGGEGIQALNTSDAIWFRDRARQLRQEQTPMEQWLWQQLRAKRFSGFKFRRQQTIGRYIVDFVCFARKLIIELDGSQHADAQEEDAARDHWLREEGFHVLRFWNNELQQQTDAVLEAIWGALQEPPLPNPSPTRGEGLNAPLLLNGGEDETGAQLLQRILLERRRRWEEKQLAKFKEQGKTPPKDWQKKYPEPVQPDTTGLPVLPEGWVWASMDQIAEVFLGKMLDKTKHTSGSKIPYLRNVNVRWGNIETEDLYEMFFDWDELDRYGLAAGDVLVCEGGEPGRAAICKKEHEGLKYQKALHRVRLFDLYEPGLLVAFLEFAAKAGQLDKTFTGSTINHFTKESFLSLQIPLPSLIEQRAIVEAIAASVRSINEQESAIDISLKQSAAQRQNILRAAFAGQLVSQDPDDEPASVLLERIRAKRASQVDGKKVRRRKTVERA